MSYNDILFMNQTCKKNQLWGFADLHTHPATHFAYGASSNGTGGLFWGVPGWSHTTLNLAADLPACANDKHSGFDADLIRHRTRLEVLGKLHEKTNWPHLPEGWPSFSTWPAARSPSHQQMHVSWIHRAYRAGLRVMVASAVDNQVLSILWHRSYGASSPTIDTSFDYLSATRQLNFLHGFVNANSSWMTIVKSPIEAYQAIKQDKLAVILGLEMDQLTANQILALVRDYHVRLVTPVHTVDNNIGGAAVYDDLFNSANHFLNGYFFSVEDDPRFRFRLTMFPEYLKYISNDPFGGGDLVKWGALEPTTTENMTYPPDPLNGHRNRIGLRSPSSLRQLMAAGLLIDIAHMSDSCTDAVIGLAEAYNYPVMDSHTGLRPASDKADDERQLSRDHASRIAVLGGMLGLGTGHQTSVKPIETWLTQYNDALDVVTGQPVALGSDMNGLAEQLSMSEVNIYYPFTIPNDHIQARRPQEIFQRLHAGTGAFDFPTRGLAHYGMLPEFICAIGRLDSEQNGEAMRSFYSSAHAVVRMWELVESSKANVP